MREFFTITTMPIAAIAILCLIGWLSPPLFKLIYWLFADGGLLLLLAGMLVVGTPFIWWDEYKTWRRRKNAKA